LFPQASIHQYSTIYTGLVQFTSLPRKYLLITFRSVAITYSQLYMSSRKRLTSNSPRKIQAEITHFTGKKPDNRSSPLKSYAAAASINRYEALSNDDEEDNTPEVDRCDRSDDTQVTANAQTPTTTEQEYQPAQSRRNQRMKAKESRRTLQPTSPLTTFMSSATKATWNEPEKPRIPTRFDG
jgi:hypothetical protein